MSAAYWESGLGPIAKPEPDHVSYRGYILCKNCSRGRHTDHTNPCHCDLHDQEEA